MGELSSSGNISLFKQNDFAPSKIHQCFRPGLHLGTYIKKSIISGNSSDPNQPAIKNMKNAERFHGRALCLSFRLPLKDNGKSTG